MKPNVEVIISPKVAKFVKKNFPKDLREKFEEFIDDLTLNPVPKEKYNIVRIKESSFKNEILTLALSLLQKFGILIKSKDDMIPLRVKLGRYRVAYVITKPQNNERPTVFVVVVKAGKREGFYD